MNDEIKILKKISEWPKCIEVSCLRLEPHRIPVYLYELSSEFHSYWNMGKDDESKRFINNEKKNTSDDKLVFLKVISNVIKSGMNIVGVEYTRKNVMIKELKYFLFFLSVIAILFFFTLKYYFSDK